MSRIVGSAFRLPVLVKLPSFLVFPKSYWTSRRTVSMAGWSRRRRVEYLLHRLGRRWPLNRTESQEIWTSSDLRLQLQNWYPSVLQADMGRPHYALRCDRRNMSWCRLSLMAGLISAAAANSTGKAQIHPTVYWFLVNCGSMVRYRQREVVNEMCSTGSAYYLSLKPNWAQVLKVTVEQHDDIFAAESVLSTVSSALPFIA